MINWKVRVKNRLFWVAIIPALLMLVKAVAEVFGYQLDLSQVSERLLSVVDAVFAVLVILGVVTDPTTAGVQDSQLAMTYPEPKKDKQ